MFTLRWECFSIAGRSCLMSAICLSRDFSSWASVCQYEEGTMDVDLLCKWRTNAEKEDT